MLTEMQSCLATIRQNKPLILCLTNYVTMDFVANGLLALGAAPLMSESIDELDELITMSHAVYINIGTLNEQFIERAVYAAESANQQNKPVILDPVGAGASTLRTLAALRILPFTSVVRGNASEIIAVSGAKSRTKGVEALHSVANAIAIGIPLAAHSNKVIAISGPEDFVTDGNQSISLPFGSPLMSLITGMGCTMTAILSAFITQNTNYFQATVQATAFFGLCGQLTQTQCGSPGSFRQKFIDNLYHPDWNFFTTIYTGFIADVI